MLIGRVASSRHSRLRAALLALVLGLSASVSGRVSASAEEDCPALSTSLRSDYSWFYVKVITPQKKTPEEPIIFWEQIPTDKNQLHHRTGPYKRSCAAIKVPNSASAGLKVYCDALGFQGVVRTLPEGKWSEYHTPQSPYLCEVMPGLTGLLGPDLKVRKLAEVPEEQRDEFIAQVAKEASSIAKNGDRTIYTDVSKLIGVREGVIAKEVLRQEVSPTCTAACIGTGAWRELEPTQRVWIESREDFVTQEDNREQVTNYIEQLRGRMQEQKKLALQILGDNSAKTALPGLSSQLPPTETEWRAFKSDAATVVGKSKDLQGAVYLIQSGLEQVALEQKKPLAE